MRIWAIALSILFAFGLTACNTVSGAGQDVQAAGEAVEDAAEHVKDEITDDDDDEEHD